MVKLVCAVIGALVVSASARADTIYICKDVGKVILGQHSLTVDGEVFEPLETLNGGGVKATRMQEGGRFRWTAVLAEDTKGQIKFVFTSAIANGDGWEPIRMETHECRRQ
ncbi:hypothetical protein ACVWWG_003823 [Bradyrhizobium sp. LB7.2]